MGLFLRDDATEPSEREEKLLYRRTSTTPSFERPLLVQPMPNLFCTNEYQVTLSDARVERRCSSARWVVARAAREEISMKLKMVRCTSVGREVKEAIVCSEG